MNRLKFIVLGLLLVSLLSIPLTSSKAIDDSVVLPLAVSQTAAPTYALDWKLAEGEVLGYITAMTPSDEKNIAANLDLESVFGEASNSPLLEQLGQLASELSFPQTASLVSLLSLNPRGNITVKMIVQDIHIDESNSESEFVQNFNTMLESMIGTVQLRGELTPDGEIASFYVEQTQRNLLALLFELPAHPVSVGDIWSLDFHCISLDASFIPSKVNRLNQVTLKEVIQIEGGQSVAILDYVIIESVDGELFNPMMDEAIPNTMTCSFIGQGRFLIEAGRWEKLTGQMSINSAGFMTSNTVQSMGLIPLLEIPPAYLELK